MTDPTPSPSDPSSPRLRREIHGLRRPTLPSLAAAALAAVALALLGYRFANLELSPFLNDEPRIQHLAQQQLVTGRWASHGLTGTQGVAYGPFILWFYGGLHALVGPDPLWSIAGLCLTLSIAHLALAASLTLLFDGGLVFFATLLSFIASSPYLFFFCRTAWDNPLVNALSAATVIVFAAQRRGPVTGDTGAAGRVRWIRALLLGLVLGAAISTHLMVLPLAALALALLAWETRLLRVPGSPPGLGLPAAAAAVAGLGILVVNIPYLRYLVRVSASSAVAHAPPGYRGFSISVWAAHFLQPARVATTWGIDRYFDAAWGDFQEWLGGARFLFEHAALPMAFCMALAILGIVATLGRAAAAPRRLAILAAATWASYPLLYAARDLGRHPHYQQPTWWVIPFGIAGALAWLGEHRPAWARAATAIVGIIAALQFSFIVSWMGYVRDRDGTRGGAYGTPIGSQRRVAQFACGMRGSIVVIENETALRPQSLEYIAEADPACAGRQVIVCPPGRCVGLPGGRPLHLRYAAEKGGALRLE